MRNTAVRWFAVVVAVSCGESPVLPNDPSNQAAVPAITSIAPLEVWGGQRVTITGTSLGHVGESVEVRFSGGASVSVVRTALGSLDVEVPFYAASGPVALQSSEGAVTGPEPLVLLGADLPLDGVVDPVLDLIGPPLGAAVMSGHEVLIPRYGLSHVVDGYGIADPLPRVIGVTTEDVFVAEGRCEDFSPSFELQTPTGSRGERTCLLPSIYAVEVSPFTPRVVVHTADDALNIYDLARERVVASRRVVVPGEVVQFFFIAPDLGLALLTGDAGGNRRVLLVELSGGTLSTVVSLDDTASCTMNGFGHGAAGRFAVDCPLSVRVYDARAWPPTVEKVLEFPIYSYPFTTLSPDGRALVRSTDSMTQVWSLDTPDVLPIVSIPTTEPMQSAWDGEELLVLVGRSDVEWIRRDTWTLARRVAYSAGNGVATVAAGGATTFLAYEPGGIEAWEVPFDGLGTAALWDQGLPSLTSPCLRAPQRVFSAGGKSFLLCDETLVVGTPESADFPPLATLVDGLALVIDALPAGPDHVVALVQDGDERSLRLVDASGNTSVVVASVPADAAGRLVAANGAYVATWNDLTKLPDGYRLTTGVPATLEPVEYRSAPPVPFEDVPPFLLDGDHLFAMDDGVGFALDLATGRAFESFALPPTAVSGALSPSGRRLWWLDSEGVLRVSPWSKVDEWPATPLVEVRLPWPVDEVAGRLPSRIAIDATGTRAAVISRGGEWLGIVH